MSGHERVSGDTFEALFLGGLDQLRPVSDWDVFPSRPRENGLVRTIDLAGQATKAGPATQ